MWQFLPCRASSLVLWVQVVTILPTGRFQIVILCNCCATVELEMRRVQSSSIEVRRETFNGLNARNGLSRNNCGSTEIQTRNSKPVAETGLNGVVVCVCVCKVEPTRRRVLQVAIGGLDPVRKTLTRSSRNKLGVVNGGSYYRVHTVGAVPHDD